MARGSANIPQEFAELLDLIDRGKLFALQEWIAGGRPLDFSQVSGARRQLLQQAIRSGFHSMVEVLARAGGWSAEDLSAALQFARDHSRFDIAELLEKFGARGKQIDFVSACEKLDFATAERHLHAGFNPSENNAFARVLCEVKAKPLIGFYKQHRLEFPVLDHQAAIALRIAVQKKDVRWVALLVWAGADPFHPAPDDLDDASSVGSEEESWSTAADDAMWRDDPGILKALHLDPTPKQAVELLASSAYRHNVAMFKDLLAKIPREKINHTERNSNEALERLIESSPEEDIFTRVPNAKGNADKLQCIELLLDAGARWDPPPAELKSRRRYLMRHDPRHIVQVIRLLLYTPGAADAATILGLCDSGKLIEKISSADAALVSELKSLKKAQRINSQNTCHTGNEEMANDAVPES